MEARGHGSRDPAARRAWTSPRSTRRCRPAGRELKNKEGKPALEVHTWEGLSPFANIARMIDLMTVFIRVMLVAIVLVSVMNVMLMAVYERIREIGTLAAIGTQPNKHPRPVPGRGPAARAGRRGGGAGDQPAAVALRSTSGRWSSPSAAAADHAAPCRWRRWRSCVVSDGGGGGRAGQPAAGLARLAHGPDHSAAARLRKNDELETHPGQPAGRRGHAVRDLGPGAGRRRAAASRSTATSSPSPTRCTASSSTSSPTARRRSSSSTR
jgi:hypothetical protein